MKLRTCFSAVLFSATFLALTLSSGCASLMNRHPGIDASRPVGGKSLNLIRLRDDVKATRLALNRTTDALNRIPGSTAPKQAYDAFYAALTDFQKLSDQTLKESADVRNRGRELFAEWSAETESIKNPEIRTAAENRRLTLQDSYNSMISPLITARTDLTQVQSDLSDIQKALALDLTPDGIGATKGAIDKITHSAATSVQSLDALAAQLDKIADVLPASTVSKEK